MCAVGRARTRNGAVSGGGGDDAVAAATYASMARKDKQQPDASHRDKDVGRNYYLGLTEQWDQTTTEDLSLN